MNNWMRRTALSAVLVVPGLMIGANMTAASEDLLKLQGMFIEGGVECPLFRVDDGRVFSLSGIDLNLVKIGAKATLWGQEQMFSTCQQGPNFGVERAEIDAL